MENVSLKITKPHYFVNCEPLLYFGIYDSNGFVCLLPKFKSYKSGDIYKNHTTKFCQFFGEKSLEIALELLRNALKTETDLDIRAEIERRLKQFRPKPYVQCLSCENFFTPKNTTHKRCEACQNRVRTHYERKHSPELRDYAMRYLASSAKKLKLIEE